MSRTKRYPRAPCRCRVCARRFGRKGALRAALRDDRRHLRAPEIVEPSRRGHGLDPGDVQNALCEAGRCLCAGAT